MTRKTSKISKLCSLRCLLATLLIAVGSIFLAYMIFITVAYDPTSGNHVLIHGRLLYHHTFAIATGTTATVLTYWLIEYFLRYSRSKTRFVATMLTALTTPFIFAILTVKLADFSVERDTPRIQEIRFGEYGKFLKNADKITLHSINPDLLEEKNQTDITFHDFIVMGSLDINEHVAIDAIGEDLEGRISSSNENIYTWCFLPRHGIRAYQGNAFKDYLICFQCHHLYVYDTEDGKHKRIALEGEKVNRLLNSILDTAEIERDRPNR